MMKILYMAVACVALVSADTLYLKDGRTIRGTFAFSASEFGGGGSAQLSEGQFELSY